MPKAEVGSTKYIANKMKAKGLQRLRWYCQICEKQCRDENGFKQHTMSEGHVRSMLLVGEDPKKFINDYSNQFQRDFLHLLKTSHGEKKVHMNNFYQEYIRDKEHIHMNATKWPSLTEFAKHLGQKGICRVEEGDRGLEISFIDDSPEAVKRREDIKRKERLLKGDEDLEAKLLEKQIQAAREQAERLGKLQDIQPKAEDQAVDAEPVKVSLALSGKAQPKTDSAKKVEEENGVVEISEFSNDAVSKEADLGESREQGNTSLPIEAVDSQPPPPPKMSMSLSGNKPRLSNPLMKRNPLSKKNDSAAPQVDKKISNAERIMKEELERKRKAEERWGSSGKKQRMGL